MGSVPSDIAPQPRLFDGTSYRQTNGVVSLCHVVMWVICMCAFREKEECRCAFCIEWISREVCGIGRKRGEIHVIVYYPKTEQGKRELAERVADVHADFVNRTIRNLNCPSEQKTLLLNAVIKAAKEEFDERN